LGGLPEATSIHLDRGYDSEATRAPARSWICGRDLEEGQAGPADGYKALGGGADRFLASEASPQEVVGVVHGEERAGDRLPGGFL
jgi:hypothetical protein